MLQTAYQNFYNKLNKNERRLFTITLLVVTLFFVQLIFFGPGLNVLKDLNQEIAMQKKVIKKDLEFLSNEDQILETYKVYSEYFLEGDENEDEIKGRMIDTIGSLAQKNNISLLKNIPSKSTETDLYVEYMTDAEMTGDVADFINFIYEVNNMSELIRVKDYSITGRRGDNDDVSASLRFSKLIMMSP